MPMYRAELINRNLYYPKPRLHDKSLVLYLPFDKDDGSYARDRSGYNNHGTIYGAIRVDGKVGKALSFDGVDDYVRTASQTLTPPLTLMAWIFYGVKTNINTIMADGKSGVTSNGFRFYVNSYQTEDRKLFIEVGNGTASSSLKSAAGLVTPNMWHHAAVVINGNNSALFLDGAQVASGSLLDFTQTNYVDIARTLSAEYYFYGCIDEVRIYNRALSQTEIIRIMNMRGI
jgi:hypothetical protein